MELKNISLLHLMKTFDIGGTEKWTIQCSNNIVRDINKVIIVARNGLYADSGISSQQKFKSILSLIN